MFMLANLRGRGMWKPNSPRFFFAEGGECIKGPLSSVGVINDRWWVIYGRKWHSPWLVHPLRADALQLRNPLFHVITFRVVAFTLGNWAEYSKVRSAVTAGSRHPLPPPCVARYVSIQQVAHEMRLAHTPINQQVLC